MGLFDTVLFMDDLDELRCAQGHALRSFQTKDIDEPSMSTYLMRVDRSGRPGRLYQARPEEHGSHAESEIASWRCEGNGAVREHRYSLNEVHGPLAIHIYGSCHACEPVLVRTAEPGWRGDIVTEHALFVDFELLLRPGEPLHIERTSGSRDELKRELSGRGAYVLLDDEPLAVAHRELVSARRRASEKTPRRSRRLL
jgi:hypothetical protein